LSKYAVKDHNDTHKDIYLVLWVISKNIRDLEYILHSDNLDMILCLEIIIVMNNGTEKSSLKTAVLLIQM